MNTWPWPVSLCHGWGSGCVPIATQLLLGITSTSPGYRSIHLDPVREIRWSFRAVVPTPEGSISVQRDRPTGPIRYSVPKSIQVTHASDPGIVLVQGKG